jgi:hypothetical protein
MTDLSPAAQAVLDAFLKAPGEVPMPGWNYGRDLAAALRAAAVYCTRERRILMTIADELEGR